MQEQETEGNWPRIKSWSQLSSWIKSMFWIQELLTEEVDGPLKERTHFKRKVLAFGIRTIIVKKVTGKPLKLPPPSWPRS